MQITNHHILQFLTDHLGTEITGIEPVEQGEWSRTFFFTTNRQKKVIRFSTFDEDFKKDQFAAHYSSPNLPIPPIEEIGEALGLFFAISAHITGKMIDHLSSDEIRAALPALLDLFNALREVDGSRTQGYGGFGADGNAPYASWRAYLTNITADAPDSRLHGWKDNLAQNQEAAVLYRVGRQRMLDLIPLCPEERHLIHNDLLHYNLILQDHQVAGVIDWGCGMWGDFLYDLAMFVTWQFYYPAMAEIDFVEEARRSFTAKNIQLPHFQERLQCYQLHLLLDSLAYNAWKQDQGHLEITIQRLKQVLSDSA